MPSLIHSYDKTLEQDPPGLGAELGCAGFATRDPADPDEILVIKLAAYDSLLPGAGICRATLLRYSEADSEVIRGWMDEQDEEQPAQVFDQAVASFKPTSSQVIGRFAYKEAQPPLAGIQITGAYVDEDYQGIKLAPRAYYPFLHELFGPLHSDSQQTSLGARLWYSSMARICTVYAINARTGEVIEQLKADAPPKIPFWDVLGLTEQQRQEVVEAMTPPVDHQHPKDDVVFRIED